MTQASDMAFLARGALEDGELNGKYNSLSSEPKRSKDSSDRIKAMASVLTDLAKEIGCTPSQVAINWVQQRPYQMIRIVGARTEKQMADNLGCLDFELTDQQINHLHEANPIDLGFPHSFLGSDHVRGLIFGKTFEQIVTNRM